MYVSPLRSKRQISRFEGLPSKHDDTQLTALVSPITVVHVCWVCTQGTQCLYVKCVMRSTRNVGNLFSHCHKKKLKKNYHQTILRNIIYPDGAVLGLS